MREREGLITRIRQVRRVAAARQPLDGPASDAEPDRLRALEARVQHLEELVTGLQDSIHRESQRQNKQIATLQDQIQPGRMSAALAEDARNRGL